MGTEHWWNGTDRGNRSAGGIPVTVTLCPPQNSHGLIRDQTRVSVVRGRLLTDCLSHGTATTVAIISRPKQHTLLHLAGAYRNVRVQSEMAHTKYRPNTAVQGRAPQLDIVGHQPKYRQARSSQADHQQTRTPNTQMT
jgi:hypothetical protein